MIATERYLGEDEELVHVTRQHWTEMVGEFVLLGLVLLVAGALVWVIPSGHDWSATAVYVVLGAAVVVSLRVWLIPLLKWRGTVYILTTKRIHVRSGFLTKTGRSIPLSRVNDVSFRASLWERIMREGTLTVESASEFGQLRLKHVPDPEGLKAKIYQAMDMDEEQQHA